MIKDPIKLGSEGRWLNLAALGRDAWNTWSNSEQHKLLEQRATVDFSGGEIVHADWAGFTFPGRARFDNAKLRGHAFFSSAHFMGEVSFDNSQFEDATFQWTRFSTRANFARCNFAGSSVFTSVQLDGDAFFNGARFSQIAHLYCATFVDAVEFSAARFCAKALFHGQERANSDIASQFESELIQIRANPVFLK